MGTQNRRRTTDKAWNFMCIIDVGPFVGRQEGPGPVSNCLSSEQNDLKIHLHPIQYHHGLVMGENRSHDLKDETEKLDNSIQSCKATSRFKKCGEKSDEAVCSK